MTTKLLKLSRNLDNQFTGKLDSAFKEKFGIELKTGYNIVSMALVSAAPEGTELTDQHREFIATFCLGWVAAAYFVYAEAHQ